MRNKTACLKGFVAFLAVLAFLTFGSPVLAFQDIGRPSPEAMKGLYPGKTYSPYAQRSFPSRVYWGETHLHTGLSLDAGLFGNKLGHEEAYRFARGEEIASATGLPVKLSRPLDWLVITDHSDMMGFATDLQRGAANILAVPKGREWYEGLEKIEDGQWIMVSGKLVEEKTEIALPNFRFGRAMLSSVHKTYHLQPEKIMSYDRVDQLPLLTDQFGIKTNRLFTKALQESGLWRDLEGNGPFTIFVPVDQAIENISGVSFDELPPDALKQLASSHIVMGKFFTRDLMEQEKLEAINDRVLQIELVNGTLRINQSRLLLKNTEARNGLIQYIYPAIIPDEWEIK